MISNSLKYYSDARRYYASAVKFTDDEYLKIILKVNIATAYKDEKKYTQSIKVYDSILPIAEKLNQQTTYTKILSNLSNVKW